MATLNLSERELEIVLLGAEGLADKEIAVRLGITHSTVTTYWVRMRAKTGGHNRGHVIAKALSAIYKASRAELLETSERFRVLVDTLSDFAVFMLDQNRKVISWNPGVERIMGYSEEAWVGNAGDVIFTEEDRANAAPEHEQSEAETKGRAQDNRWHVRQDGTRFWSSGVMVPIRGETGTTVCYCKVLQDLTRIKRLEDQIRNLGAEPVP
ncbi:MAG: PAS domain S-box protein [Fimbriimonas sp.]